MTCKRQLSVLLCSLRLACGSALGQVGTITGRVVDSAGKPVAGVTVMPLPSPVRGSYLFGPAKTDSSGAFLLKGLSAGRYRFLLSDEQRGLPLGKEATIYGRAGEARPEVEVGEGRTVDAGTLLLPEAQQKLHLTVVDAVATKSRVCRPGEAGLSALHCVLRSR